MKVSYGHSPIANANFITKQNLRVRRQDEEHAWDQEVPHGIDGMGEILLMEETLHQLIW